MSKVVKSHLLKSQEPPESALVEQVSRAPLSNALVLKYLKYCQKISVTHAQNAFSEYLKLWSMSFDTEIERSRSNQDAMELASVQRSIKQQAAELKRYFCGYFSEGFVKFNKKTLFTDIDQLAENSGSNDLSLLDNQTLEETIAISSITHRVDSHLSESLWAINQRFSVLNNGDSVTEASNPIAPIQLCDALRRSLRLLKIDVKLKIMAYKVFDKRIDEIVKPILDECNNYLLQQGILPNLKYQLISDSNSSHGQSGVLGSVKVTVSKEGDSSGESFDNSKTSEESSVNKKLLLSNDYERDLLTSIRSLQTQLSGVTDAHEKISQDSTASKGKASSDKAINGGGSVVFDAIREINLEELVLVLKKLQKIDFDMINTSSVAVSSKTLDVTKVNKKIRDEYSLSQNLECSDNTVALANRDVQTIELVGMLFEYMLSEESLQDGVKTILSYLHTPYLKIAFMDPDFFEHSEHPARLLLNALVEAGSKWVDETKKSDFGVYDKIKQVVNRVLNTYENEVKVITELLLSFRADIKLIQRKQELMEKRSKEKAQGENKLQQAKQRVNQEIKKRIQGKDLPSVVLLFLFKAWSDYLSFIILRYGSMSKSWESGLRLIDDIVLASDSKENVSSRENKQELHIKILEDVQSGLDTISFAKNKTENVVKTLTSVFGKVLDREPSEPASKTERESLEREASDKAGAKEAYFDKPSSEEAIMIENLTMIEFGTWLEFENTKRLKMAWYNAHTTQYMLVNQMGQREQMISALMLARGMIAQNIKVISGSAKPFFERALENILEKLNNQATETLPNNE